MTSIYFQERRIDIERNDSYKKLAIEAWNEREPINKIIGVLQEIKENANQCAFDQERIRTDMQVSIEVVKKGNMEWNIV